MDINLNHFGDTFSNSSMLLSLFFVPLGTGNRMVAWFYWPGFIDLDILIKNKTPPIAGVSFLVP